MEPNTKPSGDEQAAPELADSEPGLSLSEYTSRLLARSLAAADRGDFTAAEKLRDLAQKAESERFEAIRKDIEWIDAAIERTLNLSEHYAKMTRK